MSYQPGDPNQSHDPYAQQPYGQQPYGQPQYGGYFPPPEHPNATTVLIVGILSLVVCQFAGPVAWIMGRKALREIDASGGAIGGRSQVLVGYITGIVATALVAIALLIFVVAMVIVIAAAASS